MLFALPLIGWGATRVPAPEKLLPDDTLSMVTAPNFAKLRELFQPSPLNQLWNDPAMKPFRDKFMAKCQEELLTPIERELNLNLKSFVNLPQGQVTFALTRDGWQGGAEHPPGWLLLLDTGAKSGQLQSSLAGLRKKWVDANRPIRTEKIRGFEFSVLPLCSNDIPKALQKLWFSPPESPLNVRPAGLWEAGAKRSDPRAG